MDFGLSEEQRLLQDTIRRWLEAECPTTRTRTIMERPTRHDPALWQGLAELGVAGLVVPTEHGGAGLELLDAALAAEMLGWCCTPGPFLGATMAAVALVASGDAAAQATWLPAIAAGERLVTFALGEGLGEWDAARLDARVEGGKLSGEKPLVPHGEVADAIVVAACDADGPGLWIVERDAPGVTRTVLQAFDMTRPVTSLAFERTPATKLASGRAAIEAELTSMFTGKGPFRDSTLVVNDETVYFPSADVALTDADATVTGAYAPDGSKSPPMQFRVTNVWKKVGASWMVFACRPTLKPSPPAAPPAR